MEFQPEVEEVVGLLQSLALQPKPKRAKFIYMIRDMRRVLPKSFKLHFDATLHSPALLHSASVLLIFDTYIW